VLVHFYDKDTDNLHDEVPIYDPFCGSGGTSLNHFTVSWASEARLAGTWSRTTASKTTAAKVARW